MATYEMLNENSRKPIFMSVEHASNVIPERYGTLGVKKEDLAKIPDYYDVGAKPLAEVMAGRLGAKCIMPSYSRMVINVNKPVDHAKLVNDDCFGWKIPGNQNVPADDKKERVEKFYKPYHERLKKEIDGLRNQHDKVFYVAVHSFFHKLEGEERKLDIGLLYKYEKDAAFYKKVKKVLEKKGFSVAFNEPYSAHDTAGYTMNAYGKPENVNCVEFEVNDKHLRNAESIKKIGKVLSSAIKEAMDVPKKREKGVAAYV